MYKLKKIKFVFLFLLNVIIVTVADYTQMTYAEETIAVRKKGEIAEIGMITLSDAQIALKAALKIETLSDGQFWAADLLDDGMVSLEDTQIILRAALKIESIEEALSSNYEFIMKNYLVIDAITDKEIYSPGEDIQLTITATNHSIVPLYTWGWHWRGEDSCIYSQLNDGTGLKMAPDDYYVTPVGDTNYRGVLESGGILETKRVISIPEDIELGKKDYESKINYYIEVSFTCSDKNWNYNDGYDTIKEYTVKFPIIISN